MNRQHKFLFSLDEIEQQINALHELEDLVIEAQAEGEDPGIYDDKAQQLRTYFESLADSLWKAGAFSSRQEARESIQADTDVLQHVGGPGGVRPDDGQLNPDEIAQGLVALRNPNEFLFQSPLCYLSSPADVEFAFQSSGAQFRITTNFGDLRLVRHHPKLQADRESGNHLWIEGAVKEHRYDVATRSIDQLLVSIMGIMLIVGLVRHTTWSRPASQLAIGTPEHINSGAYWTMLSVRLSQHLLSVDNPVRDNELDSARSKQDRLVMNLRAVARAVSDASPAALAVRQASRMFLRSYDVWNAGEAAMFLAITMEGLLLDKRQKDDLSARLQDSVAYWIGGSAGEREKNRKSIAELYKVRSNYVHNGEEAPSVFDLDHVRELTRRVVRKELLTLGNQP